MTFDDQTRARLVREWMSSPLKQTEFCAAHGISTRVLREWARRFGTRRHAAVEGAPIDSELAALQRCLAALDAACRRAR